MRAPLRSVIAGTAVLGALGIAISGGFAAGNPHPAAQQLSPVVQAHAPIFAHTQRGQHHAFVKDQIQVADDAATRLGKALFTGDLATFNSLSAYPKGRQQDLNADHERKDTLLSGPALAGAPAQDLLGNLVVHLTATAKAPDGKTVAWTLDIAVSPTSFKVVSIDAHRNEIGEGSGH